MNSFNTDEDGFTGLEAAIVLIAFVVVAAVFSYVVLGAGFFTTQKSQEVVHTGVAQASSTLQIIGNVYGVATASGQPISYVNFSIGLAPGGTAVDVSKMVITYSTPSALETLSLVGTIGSDAGAGEWNVVAVRNNRGATENFLLESGEQFDIKAHPTNTIAADTTFNLELKPIVGTALDIRRTVPAGTKVLNILY